MKTITRSQLRDLLAKTKGATPITISALTDTDARKTGNPYRQVLKLARVNGMTGCSYENSVNRQREREGKEGGFMAAARAWGERHFPCLVQKGEKWYLVIHPQTVLERAYFGRTAEGMLRHVKREEVEPFLPRAAQPARQGVDRPVTYRNYSLANIVAIVMDRETYRVIGV